MVNTSGIGQATFLLVTARRACREAKSSTQFFRVSKRQPISRESTARLLSIRIWRLSSEVALAFQRLAPSADFERLLIESDGGAQGAMAWVTVDFKTTLGQPLLLESQ